MSQKKSVNANLRGELTIEKLRSYAGFEDFSDEKAQEAIQNIKRFAKILFLIYQNEMPPEYPVK